MRKTASDKLRVGLMGRGVEWVVRGKDSLPVHYRYAE